MVKGDIKKGLRGIPLDGKTLRYTHGNVGLFAQAGYEKLVAQGRIAATANISANDLMSVFLINWDITVLALWYGLLADQPRPEPVDDKKIAEEMGQIADAWTEAGNSDQELRRKILEAFYLATVPSGVPSMKERWQRLDQEEEESKTKDVEGRKESEKLTAMDKKIEAARNAANMRIKKAEIARLEEIQKTPISPSPDLPASS